MSQKSPDPTEFDPVIYLKSTVKSYDRLLKLMERDRKMRDYSRVRYSEQNGTTLNNVKTLVAPIQLKVLSKDDLSKEASSK